MADTPRVDIRAVLLKLGIDVVRENRDGLVALCPFHRDAHPSWSIGFRGQRYGLHHCHSCSHSGTLVGLVMHVRGLIAPASAYDWLRSFEVPENAPPLPSRLRVETTGARRFEMPRGFARAPLEDWPSLARKYVEGRGITAAQVERWGIGYSQEGRLEGRVIFPVLRADGSPASYQARTYVGEKPRYLCSSDGDGHDLDVMFGERWWGQHGRRRAIVLEGTVKALAVERVAPRVAFGVIGGSNVRPAHLLRLSRFEEVLVGTDANEAGDRAAEALLRALARHVRTARLRFPKDPDEMPPEDLRACLGDVAT